MKELCHMYELEKRPFTIGFGADENRQLFPYVGECVEIFARVFCWLS